MADAAVSADPQPLKPLGATDSHNFANGVIVYWRDGNACIHAGPFEPAITVPMNLFPIIVAVLRVLGLTDEQAALIAEAAESERPR